ncbi:MAG: TPM domain-containing protein [Actinomycetota bacterium]
MTRGRAPIWLAALILVFVATPAIAQDFPRFSAPVVDAADAIPDDTEAGVSEVLLDYQRRSTNQIAVAVVDTIGESSIEDYAEDLFDAWGVGEKDEDNGVLLVIAMQERAIRIEVGFGVEADLTDLEAGRIVREQIEPRMRAGDRAGAIEAGTDAIRVALGDSEAVAPPALEAEPDDSNDSFFPLIFGIIPFLFILSAVNRRNRRGGRGRGRRDFSLFPIFLGSGWGGGSTGGGFGGGGFGGGGFGGGGGGGSGGGGASGGW